MTGIEELRHLSAYDFLPQEDREAIAWVRERVRPRRRGDVPGVRLADGARGAAPRAGAPRGARDVALAHLVDVADGRLDARVPGVRRGGRRASEEIGGVMVSEAIRELTLVRKEVCVALDALAGGGRVGDAAPACARAVEGLCAALAELAWAECDRALYGDGGGQR